MDWLRRTWRVVCVRGAARTNHAACCGYYDAAAGAVFVSELADGCGGRQGRGRRCAAGLWLKVLLGRSGLGPGLRLLQCDCVGRCTVLGPCHVRLPINWTAAVGEVTEDGSD